MARKKRPKIIRQMEALGRNGTAPTFEALQHYGDRAVMSGTGRGGEPRVTIAICCPYDVLAPHFRHDYRPSLQAYAIFRAQFGKGTDSRTAALGGMSASPDPLIPLPGIYGRLLITLSPYHLALIDWLWRDIGTLSAAIIENHYRNNPKDITDALAKLDAFCEPYAQMVQTLLDAE